MHFVVDIFLRIFRNFLRWLFPRENVKTSKKQPPRGVLRKKCSENIQQIYRRTPMPKCDFNKLSEHVFIRTLLEDCFRPTT